VTDANPHDLALKVLQRCDRLAKLTEDPGRITRPFLCATAAFVHELVREWMQAAGMSVRVDALGNIIGHLPGANAGAPVFLIGSHLDTVPDAGRYDGILGVLLGIAAVAGLKGTRLPFAVEVIGFSEEEGVRYRTSYLGSKAVCGSFDLSWLAKSDAAGVTMGDALRRFGLDPHNIPAAAYPHGRVLGYLETHIEQGPVLESLDRPLGVVQAIVGQSRLWLTFEGAAGHAGTQPMAMRRDALVAAAQFIVAVEQRAQSTEGLRATVGVVSSAPGAVNVVPGLARVSLDVRHATDAIREAAVDSLLADAHQIGKARDIRVGVERAEQHPAVPMNPRLTALLADAAETLGHRPLHMASGAGHDAAVMASITQVAMLFVRSPGGISHHPGEAVLPLDIEAALGVMIAFLHRLAKESTHESFRINP